MIEDHKIKCNRLPEQTRVSIGSMHGCGSHTDIREGEVERE